MKQELTTNEISKAIEALRGANSSPIDPPTLAWMPAYMRTGLDRKKYRGRGRPRRDDYIYEKTEDILRGKGDQTDYPVNTW